MITTKQRSRLRAMANDYDAIFQIGKAGITDVLVSQVSDALEARELVKINVLNNSGLDTREACRIMAEQLGADPVSCVGHKFVLYRRSTDKPRISLD